MSCASSWKQLVLKSMPDPAWLGPEAPEGDVVLSTRVRLARNLRGVAYPHNLSPEGLHQVQRQVVEAAQRSELQLELISVGSRAEREYLLGSHLLSPEFPVGEPGRVLMLDASRAVSLMVNEEDHLRLQVLTPGWSLIGAKRLADYVVHQLGKHLEFAHTPQLGYVTASPQNCGPGLRASALVHLVGLAQSRRLKKVLIQCAEKGIIVRGLYGESSRGVGAFFQLSTVQELDSNFNAAVEHLISLERRARQLIPSAQLEELSGAALDFAVTQVSLSLADALRVLAWARWAATAGLSDWPDYRALDRFVASLDVQTPGTDEDLGRRRAEAIRDCFGR